MTAPDPRHFMFYGSLLVLAALIATWMLM